MVFGLLRRGRLADAGPRQRLLPRVAHTGPEGPHPAPCGADRPGLGRRARRRRSVVRARRARDRRRQPDHLPAGASDQAAGLGRARAVVRGPGSGHRPRRLPGDASAVRDRAVARRAPGTGCTRRAARPPDRARSTRPSAGSVEHHPGGRERTDRRSPHPGTAAGHHAGDDLAERFRGRLPGPPPDRPGSQPAGRHRAGAHPPRHLHRHPVRRIA